MHVWIYCVVFVCGVCVECVCLSVKYVCSFVFCVVSVCGVCVECLCLCVFIDVLENKKMCRTVINLSHVTSAVCFMKSRDYLILKIHLRLEEMWV